MRASFVARDFLMTDSTEDSSGKGEAPAPAPASGGQGGPAVEKSREHGGPKGPEPTRYGDWEKNGRCIDF